MVAHQGWQVSAGIDTSTPNHARVYDYVLGGKDNFAVDREAAKKVLAVAPDTRRLARANRAFLVRTVRFVAESGIRQFIDLGTGIPTSPNVHQVARGVDDSARVVYVDNDPIVVEHNHALLASDEGVVTIEADIRRPAEILGNPELEMLIDFDEPVAVLMVAVLHLVTAQERPGSIVAQFRERMTPGSHIVLSQFAADSDPEAAAQLRTVYANAPTRLTFRPRDEILRFFEGFEVLTPGLVDVERWRPETPGAPTKLKVAGGVGRKI